MRELISNLVPLCFSKIKLVLVLRALVQHVYPSHIR